PIEIYPLTLRYALPILLHSAEVLQPSFATTTVSRHNGDTRVQDGPFADSKEQLAGLFVLDVPDLDAALAWAEKCPAAQWGAVEIDRKSTRLNSSHVKIS